MDAPLEKIEYVQTNLMKFVNSQLSKIGITIENLTGDFNDGVNLILLIGLLKGKNRTTTYTSKNFLDSYKSKYIPNIGIRG